jgi:hypothetical protein
MTKICQGGVGLEASTEVRPGSRQPLVRLRGRVLGGLMCQDCPFVLTPTQGAGGGEGGAVLL